MKILTILFPLLAFFSCFCVRTHAAPLVFQSDFGLGDGAVSAMYGVAREVSLEIPISDLSHDVPPYNIWVGAYLLSQTAAYWPEGTVFVSVVDPGVGTERKSVVMKSASGHFFVTPDNGTLTLVAEQLGVSEVREIDEAVNRRKNSEASYTFHGRDVYAYTGARLASGAISFEDVGPSLGKEVLKLEYQHAEKTDEKRIRGAVPILDVRYGNVWTNISKGLFEELGIGTMDTVAVTISHAGEVVYEADLPYASTFGDVPEGEPLLYINSLLNVSFALNMGDFAEKNAIGFGNDWSVELSVK